MTDLVTLILLGIAVGFPLAVQPGPVTRRTIRGAAKYGVWAGPRAGGGLLLADLAMVTGLGALALARPDLAASTATVTGILAGGALIVVGFRLMDRRVAGTLGREQGNGDAPPRHENPVLDRVLSTLANPVWHLFWWTAGLRLVPLAAARGTAGVAALAAGYLLPGLLWPAFVAARLARPERMAALPDRQYRILTSLGGLALVAVGFGLGSVALGESGVKSVMVRAVAALFGGEAQ